MQKGTYEARIACNLGYKEPAFAYLKVREKDKKHPFFTQSGTDREDNPDQYIANMRDGAWAGCKYFSFEGETRISVKIRGKAKGVLEISTARNGAPVAALPCPGGRDGSLAERVRRYGKAYRNLCLVLQILRKRSN